MPYIRSRTLQTSLNVIRLSSWTNRRTFSIFSLVRIENGRHEHTKSFKEALPLLKRKHHSNICVPPIMRGFTRMFINLRKYLITVKTKQCKFSDPDSLPFHWTTTIAEPTETQPHWKGQKKKKTSITATLAIPIHKKSTQHLLAARSCIIYGQRHAWQVLKLTARFPFIRESHLQTFKS